MLDTFLKVAYDHEKTAAGKEYTVDLLKQLPNDYLQALASGEVKLAHLGCDSGGDYDWLEKFKGSPLFDQALQLEQKTLEMDLQKQQTNNERRQMWDKQDQEMDQLRIQKKLLDLQLVQQEGQAAGGGMPAPAEGAPPELPVEAASPGPAAAANPVSVKVGSEKRAFTLKELKALTKNIGKKKQAFALALQKLALNAADYEHIQDPKLPTPKAAPLTPGPLAMKSLAQVKKAGVLGDMAGGVSGAAKFVGKTLKGVGNVAEQAVAKGTKGNWTDDFTGQFVKDKSNNYLKARGNQAVDRVGSFIKKSPGAAAGLATAGTLGTMALGRATKSDDNRR